MLKDIHYLNIKIEVRVGARTNNRFDETIALLW